MPFSRTVLSAIVIALLGNAAAIGPAAAETFTLRIASGHPQGVTPYVSLMSEFFVAGVK